MGAGADAGPILDALRWLEGLDPVLLHFVLAAGAFLENVFPPVPADTVIVVGGVLAGRGAIPMWSMALAVGGANVGGAYLVYLLGRRFGHDFFVSGPGRHVLTASQLERVERWHARRGVGALFLVRLLPALRSVAPAFAGIGGLSPLRVAAPLVGASLLWYGGLMWGGYAAGQNLDALAARIDQLNTALWLTVGAVLVATLLWWRRSRGGGDA